MSNVYTEGDYIKVEDFKPCTVCGKDTDRINYIFETRVCSGECTKELVDEYLKSTSK